MNNGHMDRGNENPTQHLPWWLKKNLIKPSQIVRNRDLNLGPLEYEPSVLLLCHLAQFINF